MQGNQFAGSAGYGDDRIGDRMIDKQGLLALADRQMRRILGIARQKLELVAGNADEHRTPIVLVRDAPDRRSENVCFAVRQISDEAAPPQGIGQTKSAAMIHVEQFGELGKRDRIGGLDQRLENHQSAIETLDRRRVLTGQTISHERNSRIAEIAAAPYNRLRKRESQCSVSWR